jgi:site-specific DNA-methyltransferase (adenine-specific)
MTKLQIRNIDCMDAALDFPGESIDVIVTSPPYNLGIAYAHYDDTRAREEFLTWLTKRLVAMRSRLKLYGSMFLNIGTSPTNPMLPFELIPALVMNGFVLQNTFHWIKSISLPTETGYMTKGHFKPLNSPRFVNDCHEYVFHLTLIGKSPINRLAVGVPFRDKSNIKRFAGNKGDLRCRGNNWFVPYETIQNRKAHPATFPVGLAEMCLRLSGVGDTSTVVDLFNGTGTTGKAAINCGAGRFVGFDIDKTYCDMAISVLDEHARVTGRKIQWEN